MFPAGFLPPGRSRETLRRRGRVLRELEDQVQDLAAGAPRASMFATHCSQLGSTAASSAARISSVIGTRVRPRSSNRTSFSASTAANSLIWCSQACGIASSIRSH
jgi:hypothetical protein